LCGRQYKSWLTAAMMAALFSQTFYRRSIQLQGVARIAGDSLKQGKSVGQVPNLSYRFAKEK
jgi:hypothetical protein